MFLHLPITKGQFNLSECSDKTNIGSSAEIHEPFSDLTEELLQLFIQPSSYPYPQHTPEPLVGACRCLLLVPHSTSILAHIIMALKCAFVPLMLAHSTWMHQHNVHNMHVQLDVHVRIQVSVRVAETQAI